MIKVLEGFKVKQGADMQPILLRLRSDAMQYPGFVSAENLINRRDVSIVIIISTWEKVEDWEMWENSELRLKLLREAEPVLEDKTRATSYGIMPTQG